MSDFACCYLASTQVIKSVSFPSAIQSFSNFSGSSSVERFPFLILREPLLNCSSFLFSACKVKNVSPRSRPPTRPFASFYPALLCYSALLFWEQKMLINLQKRRGEIIEKREKEMTKKNIDTIHHTNGPRLQWKQQLRGMLHFHSSPAIRAGNPQKQIFILLRGTFCGKDYWKINEKKLSNWKKLPKNACNHCNFLLPFQFQTLLVTAYNW